MQQSTPPTLAGLFFCLASAEGAGLLFCPAAIQPHTSVYSAFCSVHAVIPTTPQNGAQGFTMAFPEICPILTPQIPNQHNKPLHSLRHAGAHHNAAAPPAHTRRQRHAGRCAGQHSRPIIIRYIRVQRCAPVMDPCQTVQRIAGHASPAGSRYFPRPAVCSLAPGQPDKLHPAGQSSSRKRGGRRGTIDGYRRTSFRAFAR